MKPLLVVTAQPGNKRQLARALESIGVEYMEASTARDVGSMLDYKDVGPPVLIDADGLGSDLETILTAVESHGVEAAVLTKYPRALSPAKLPKTVRVVAKPPSQADFRAIVQNLTEGS